MGTLVLTPLDIVENTEYLQSLPLYFELQTQRPPVHTPLFQQLNGHTDSPQSAPEYPELQAQVALIQTPCPVTQAGEQVLIEQSTPVKPEVQAHMPDVESHVPCPEQPFGHPA